MEATITAIALAKPREGPASGMLPAGGAARTPRRGSQRGGGRPGSGLGGGGLQPLLAADGQTRPAGRQRRSPMRRIIAPSSSNVLRAKAA
jgi:hypothetical protein